MPVSLPQRLVSILMAAFSATLIVIHLFATLNQSAVLASLDQNPTVDQHYPVLIDDFEPQPLMGEPSYHHNRLGGNRGAWGDSTQTVWGQGQVTVSMPTGQPGGLWFSLNHTISEKEPLNFTAVLPAAIMTPYQSSLTDLSIHIADGTPAQTLLIELKDESVTPLETVGSPKSTSLASHK